MEDESSCDRNKTLSAEEYHNKIRRYLKDIKNLKTSDTWKVQLTITINFISSIDNDEDCVLHWNSDNIEVKMNYEAKEIKKNFLIHLKIDIKTIWNQWKIVSLVFYYAHLLYYKCHKINPNRSGWYIDSPDWMKNKKQQ